MVTALKPRGDFSSRPHAPPSSVERTCVTLPPARRHLLRAGEKPSSRRGPGPRAGTTTTPTAAHLPMSAMTPNRPDPYTVLGVASNATQAEISRAYRAEVPPGA